MSYWKQQEIIDTTGNLTEVTPYGEIHTVEPVRVAGGVFNDSSVDPSFFTVTNTNGGTTSVTNTIATLATNTTANGATQIYTSQIARMIGGSSNRFYGRIFTGDSGTANNVRRWGMMSSSATDGIYFKLAGTSLSVNTMEGGVETSVTISPSITLTNLNLYEIDYNSGTVYFVINGLVVYTLTALTPYVNNLQLACFIDNTNSASLATNITISALNLSAYRLGRLSTQPIAGRITSAATTTFKQGPGILHRITLNNPSGTLITVYDSLTGSGSTIAVINTPVQANPVTLEYGVEFSNGMTVVSTGTWDATIVFE